MMNDKDLQTPVWVPGLANSTGSTGTPAPMRLDEIRAAFEEWISEAPTGEVTLWIGDKTYRLVEDESKEEAQDG